MADGSLIEWTDATWNVVNGCSLASPGCTNCDAIKQAHRFPARQGLTVTSKGGMVWTGEVRFNEALLTQPLRWKRPRRIFVCAHGDLFHENVPDEWIDLVFAVMALCPHHTFQVLTKRSNRMWRYLADPATPDRIYDLVCDMAVAGEADVVLIAPGLPTDIAPAGRHVHLSLWPLPNVWLGVSVEDQARADLRIPDLLATPAAVHWLSCEPLLGPLDLTAIPYGEVVGNVPSYLDALSGRIWQPEGTIDRPLDPRSTIDGRTYVDLCAGVKWAVVGGESGPYARPMHPNWPRSLRDQCQAAGVAFHFKQWGEWKRFFGWVDGVSSYSDASGTYRADQIHRFPDGAYAAKVGKRAAGRLLDGVEWSEYPQ